MEGAARECKRVASLKTETRDSPFLPKSLSQLSQSFKDRSFFDFLHDGTLTKVVAKQECGLVQRLKTLHGWSPRLGTLELSEISQETCVGGRRGSHETDNGAYPPTTGSPGKELLDTISRLQNTVDNVTGIAEIAWEEHAVKVPPLPAPKPHLKAEILAARPMHEQHFDLEPESGSSSGVSSQNSPHFVAADPCVRPPRGILKNSANREDVWYRRDSFDQLGPLRESELL